jgi:hypothetical protein
MKAVAVSLFLLAVLMVFAGVKGFSESTSWAGSCGAFVPAAIVIYMFLRVARECRALERQERERASDR